MIQCPDCKKIFSSPAMLLQHRRKKHLKKKISGLHPFFRKKLKEKRQAAIKKHLTENMTGLEKKFQQILEALQIRFQVQYQLKNKFYDFYLPDHNTIVETHGDYFHCNPEKYSEPKYKIQKVAVKNDKKKKLLCEQAGIRLIYYWETDVNEKPHEVMADLAQKLGLFD